uniref:Macro domain-containing protein n=1 Tax=Astyanax mexicanus TaxID=7994 RepID=A0A3B1K2X3_ASTMX
MVKNKVNVDFKDDKISLNGPRVHISQCKPVFEDLLSTLYQGNLKVAKPGARKFFKKKETMYISEAKNNTGCLVELVDEVEAGGASGKKGVFTPEGVEIVVSKGDMCSYTVDAVVNAANDKLEFNGGLSKAISDAAGPQLQDACHQIIKARKKLNIGEAVVTKAGGQLCCKFVIHAVGPQFDQSNRQGSIQLLKTAVIGSLKHYNNLQSVAIPAISSGLYNFPRHICADIIVNTVKSFSDKQHPQSTSLEVRLVNNDDPSVREMLRACQQFLGPSATQSGAIQKHNSCTEK